MGRIRQGAMLAVELPRADSRFSGYLMHVSCKFVGVQLYKQTKAYTKGSSFYVVVCDAQSQSLEAFGLSGRGRSGGLQLYGAGRGKDFNDASHDIVDETLTEFANG